LGVASSPPPRPPSSSPGQRPRPRTHACPAHAHALHALRPLARALPPLSSRMCVRETYSCAAAMRDAPAQPQTSPLRARARDAWANQGPAPWAVQDAARRRARAGACAGAGAARVGHPKARLEPGCLSKQSTRPRPAEPWAGKSISDLECQCPAAEEAAASSSMFACFSSAMKQREAPIAQDCFAALVTARSRFSRDGSLPRPRAASAALPPTR
ncbi:hypothetical protein B0J12DRAFT_753025, partial [Macrophomina phaseolina]